MAQALLEVGERDDGARLGHHVAVLVVIIVVPEAKVSTNGGK